MLFTLFVELRIRKCLQKLYLDYPHITYVYEIGKSLRGRPLSVLAIGKFPNRHSPGIPEFKYVANIHGNEVSLFIYRKAKYMFYSHVCPKYSL